VSSSDWLEKSARLRAAAEAEATSRSSDILVSALALLLELGGDWKPLLQCAIPDLTEWLEAVRLEHLELAVDAPKVADWLWVSLTDALAVRVSSTVTPAAQLVLDLGKRLDRAPTWVAPRWLEVTANRLNRLSSPARAAWVTELGREPRLLQEEQVDPSPVRVVKHSATWRIDYPLNILSEDPVGRHELSNFWPQRLLHAMNRDDWFRAVDGWRDARMVLATLYGRELMLSPAWMADLLRNARRCFDELGTATASSSVIVFAKLIVVANGHLLEEEISSTIADQRWQRRLFHNSWSVWTGRESLRRLAKCLLSVLC
jgi:hypothetical protein